MEYHTFDPFENADVNGRFEYYDIWGIPCAIFDGGEPIFGGGAEIFDQYLSAYDSTMNLLLPCTLSLFVDYNSNTRQLWVKTEIFGVDTVLNAHLRYAIAESHIHCLWGDMGWSWIAFIM